MNVSSDAGSPTSFTNTSSTFLHGELCGFTKFHEIDNWCATSEPFNEYSLTSGLPCCLHEHSLSPCYALPSPSPRLRLTVRLVRFQLIGVILTFLTFTFVVARSPSNILNIIDTDFHGKGPSLPKPTPSGKMLKKPKSMRSTYYYNPCFFLTFTFNLRARFWCRRGIVIFKNVYCTSNTLW